MSQETLLTVPEIAQRLRKSKNTIYGYIDKGLIPSALLIRLGNTTGVRATIRMKESDLEQFIEASKGQ